MSTSAYGFNIFINSATTDPGKTPRVTPAITLPANAVWHDALRWEWDIEDGNSPGVWYATGNRVLTLPSHIPGGNSGSLNGAQLSLGIFDLNVTGSNPNWTAAARLAQWVVAFDVDLPGNRTGQNQALFAAPPQGVTTSSSLQFANGRTTGRITFTQNALANPLGAEAIRALPRYDGGPNPTTPVQGMAVWDIALTFAQGANLPGSATCNASMWVQMQVGTQQVFFYKDPEMDFEASPDRAAAAAAGGAEH